MYNAYVICSFICRYYPFISIHYISAYSCNITLSFLKRACLFTVIIAFYYHEIKQPETQGDKNSCQYTAKYAYFSSVARIVKYHKQKCLNIFTLIYAKNIEAILYSPCSPSCVTFSPVGGFAPVIVRSAFTPVCSSSGYIFIYGSTSFNISLVRFCA